MPTIRVNREDLMDIIGRDVDRETLESILFMLKTELEVWGEEIELSVDDSERPDLWSSEGIGRAVRTYITSEHPEYVVRPSSYEIKNERPSSRPIIMAAVVKNVRMDEEVLFQIIQLQEKIMMSYGRNRKRVAIGTSNADKISFPLTYKKGNPNISFVPLGEEREMTLEEILHYTEKGRQYAHLVREGYPIILDSKGRVVTFPPIINSNDIGRIDEHTKNIFIDVTGDDPRRVETALNVMVTALVERGGEVYEVKINGKSYPDLSFRPFEVDTSYMKRLGGTEDLTPLRRMGYRIEGNTVYYPPYRGDIRSQSDVLEDLLSSIDYNSIPLLQPDFYTKGSLHKETELINAVRDIMSSIGEELNTLTLTDPELYNRLSLPLYVKLSNPVSSTHSHLRSSLLPHLLRALSHNKTLPYPQSLFEVGEVYTPHREIRVAYVYASPSSTYTSAAQALLFLYRKLGREPSLTPSSHPLFIEGRTASTPEGIVGEIHPRVLEVFDIEVPVAAFEITLSAFLQ